ncbi:MAG: hypothetical protein J6T47_02270, partial [Lachnospiraceae bacterium]|nr:hypothetical protein [Lachnospiraceae bacterium]
MSKEIAESIGQKRRPRRRVSRARREAFRRKKIDTGSEYFHPLIYFVGLFVYLEMVFHRAQFPNGILFYLMLIPLVVAGVFLIFPKIVRRQT